MLLEAASTAMLKKQIDAQALAALQLIQSATTATATGDIGGLLNITA
jgi:hypothetical protein